MLDDVLTEIRPVLVSTLIGVAIVFLGIVSAAAMQLKAHVIGWLGKLSDDRRWGAAIGKLDEATTAAVQAVEQTLAVELKHNVAPRGELTLEQALRLRDAAFAEARRHLGPQVWREILDSLKLEPGEVEELLRTRIEAAVHRMRTAGGRLGELVGTEPDAP